MLQRALLLSGPSTDLNRIGDPVPISDGMGSPARNITVAVYPSRLTGTVHIEATLLADPGDGDWFDLVAPVSFSAPRGDVIGAGRGTTTDQRPVVVNTKAKVVAVRARLDRSGLPAPVAPISVTDTYGGVDRVIMIA